MLCVHDSVGLFFFFKQKTAYEIMPSLVGSEMCIRDRLDALVESLGGGENRISQVPIDLASMPSVRSAAREINRYGGHIDALLNVAAVFVGRYHKTSDGFEHMLATNYFGPFLLTNLLRDRPVS